MGMRQTPKGRANRHPEDAIRPRLIEPRANASYGQPVIPAAYDEVSVILVVVVSRLGSYDACARRTRRAGSL